MRESHEHGEQKETNLISILKLFLVFVRIDSTSQSKQISNENPVVTE